VNFVEGTIQKHIVQALIASSNDVAHIKSNYCTHWVHKIPHCASIPLEEFISHHYTQYTFDMALFYIILYNQ
jgi:hypothetical protein